MDQVRPWKKVSFLTLFFNFKLSRAFCSHCEMIVTVWWSSGMLFTWSLVGEKISLWYIIRVGGGSGGIGTSVDEVGANTVLGSVTKVTPIEDEEECFEALLFLFVDSVETFRECEEEEEAAAELRVEEVINRLEVNKGDEGGRCITETRYIRGSDVVKKHQGVNLLSCFYYYIDTKAWRWISPFCMRSYSVLSQHARCLTY